MDGKRLLHSLRLENFLSYGPEGVQLELEPLNILIGQNASGKSNLIQAIELLRATPTNLTTPVIQGGGVEGWLYKGGGQIPTSGVVAKVDYPATEDMLSHAVLFTARGSRFQLVNEVITNISSCGYMDTPAIYYDYRGGDPVIVVREMNDTGPSVTDWKVRVIDGIKSDLSILAQRNDPDSYPAINYLAEQYRAINIYRSFNFDGPNSMRRAQQPDLPTDFLEEDGRNLSLVLNDLQYRGALDIIVEKLKAVYEDVESINVRVAGGTVQTFLRERGMSSPIPAARLSDGTLRYL